jgi:serine/threonine protein phosphatase 1
MIHYPVDLPRRGFFKSPATAPGERVYAIGDIHGRLDLFTRLIREIETDNAARGGHSTRIILLGDIIDRGPSSRALLQLLMEGQEQGGRRFLVLLGNHEAALLDAAAGDANAQQTWLKFGGMATLESYGIAPPIEGEDSYDFAERLANGIGTDTLEWLRDLPLYDRSGDFFFCHAGVRPGVTLRRQSRDDLLWIRDEFMESARNHGAMIVHGHNVVEAVEVKANRISVDTGAYRSEMLSAIGLEGREAWVIATEPE